MPFVRTSAPWHDGVPAACANYPIETVFQRAIPSFPIDCDSRSLTSPAPLLATGLDICQDLLSCSASQAQHGAMHLISSLRQSTWLSCKGTIPTASWPQVSSRWPAPSPIIDNATAVTCQYAAKLQAAIEKARRLAGGWTLASCHIMIAIPFADVPVRQQTQLSL